jgi:heavy metal sensor kinase
MSSAKSRRGRLRLGVQARLTLWTAAVLALSLVVGFAWVHHGLRAVLEAKNDAFLARKGAELLAVARDDAAAGDEALEAEIRREVDAYEAEGLVVVVRRAGAGPGAGPGRVLIAPDTEPARRLADRLSAMDAGLAVQPQTLTLERTPGPDRYRAIRIASTFGAGTGVTLELGLALAETEAILAQFDRRVAAGGLVFLALAACGGLVFSHQALRPVARSIRTARRLNPADLSARLPLTGAGDELDQLAGTINDLLDRLADYHAQVTRFTADASHELRSPLGAMRAAIEVALQQPRPAAEYREILGTLGEQCERLTALVNGLLLLARADAGQVELRREPVDLAALVVAVAEMYQPLAEERNVTLTLSLTSGWDQDQDRPNPLYVAGDPSRLRQLVTNLVDNAIKFTGPVDDGAGRVSIGLERIEDQARLRVVDNGVGILPEHLPHLFERFYQADPARSAGGTGLGLSICRWIAEAHGGSIHAASERPPGRGSTFTVLLPTMQLSVVSCQLSVGKGPLLSSPATDN